jgi:hypothetical protein
MKKLTTIDLKGKAYATVPTRIKEFREANPNGDISTKPEILTDGQVMFTATITKSKADPTSASATGHSIGKISGDKAFEKLETIAIGRALAILGYMSSGEVASSEEMEQFMDYIQEKKTTAIDNLKSAKSLDELKTIFTNLPSNIMADVDVIATKDSLKTSLKK